MSRNLLKVFVLLSFLCVGTAQLKAQDKFEPLSEDVRHRCDSILGLSATPEAMKKPFVAFLRKYIKNVDQLYRAAEYFSKNNNYSCAKFCIDQAYEKNSKNLDILRLRGDILERAEIVGEAAQMSDAVLAIDSINLGALMKGAYNLRVANPIAAMELLLKAKKYHPGHMDADRMLGYYYYIDAKNATNDSVRKANRRLAIKHYGDWFNATPVDSFALKMPEGPSGYYYCNDYLWALSDAKSYAKCIKEIERIEAFAPESPINYKKNIKQRKLFCLIQNYDLPAARKAMDYILNNEYPDSVYDYYDYVMAGELYKTENNLPEAIKWQRKAVEKNAQKGKKEGNKLLFDYLFEYGSYEEALPVYKTYLAFQEENKAAGIRDSAMLGNIYHNLALQARKDKDSLKLAEFVHLGDSVWARISEMRPNESVGPQGRANINALTLDGSLSGVAVDHYKEMIRRIEASRATEGELYAKEQKHAGLEYIIYYALQENKNDEALSYIGQMDTKEEKVAALEKLIVDHFYARQRYKEALEYMDKLEEIDPNNRLMEYRAGIQQRLQ